MNANELVRRAVAGDTDARNRLLTEWMPVVERTVGRMRIPPHSLDDLVQEALVGLIERLRLYDPERGALGAWVRFTARHVVLDHLRRRGGGVVRLTRHQMRARREAGLDVATLCVSLEEPVCTFADGGGSRIADLLPDPSGARAEAVERRELVEAALAAVDDRERSVLDLLYPRDGRAPWILRRVGARLGISESRVAQLRERAFEKMRAALSGAAG